MPVGPYGAITGADIINSNQSAIQTAASQLRQKFSNAPTWTYGADGGGISDAQRQAGMNANLLRAGGAGIGQLLGFDTSAQGGRAGDIIAGGLAAGGDLQGMQKDTEQYLKAPTYVAPPAPAEAPKPTGSPGRKGHWEAEDPNDGVHGPVEKPRRTWVPDDAAGDEPTFTKPGRKP